MKVSRGFRSTSLTKRSKTLKQPLKLTTQIAINSEAFGLEKESDTLKACLHLFPKQDTLYPEAGDFVAESGNKVACFR